MPRSSQPLPQRLGTTFSVAEARASGVSQGRLRNRNLEKPFHGVRAKHSSSTPGTSHSGDCFARAKHLELELIDALSKRLVPGQFFSHRSAAFLWQIPQPHLCTPELHLSTLRPQSAPRIRAGTVPVFGHALNASRTQVTVVHGFPVTDPASTFAMLGNLCLTDLVAAGDALVRKYRGGHGRRHVGRAPVATVEELKQAVSLGQWKGMTRLREALSLIREDSWSPKESSTRVILVTAGLPDPELNVDIYDREGFFIACADMVFKKYRVITEYHGLMHESSYAQDIERVEALRNAGWEVIQVTRALERYPTRLVARVAAALRRGGWAG
ncbi:hypothetical protein [Leucobacter sp. GX24907]